MRIWKMEGMVGVFVTRRTEKWRSQFFRYDVSRIPSMAKFHNISLVWLIVVCCAFVLSGCMATSVWKDDFTQIGDDFLSKLVKDSISEVNPDPHHYDEIRQSNVMKNGKTFFVGKNEEDVSAIFNKNGGRCTSVNLSIEHNIENILKCEISKTWRLRNIGYPYFDLIKDIPDYWPIPGVKLIFKFNLSPNKDVTNAEIETVDITVEKNIIK